MQTVGSLYSTLMQIEQNKQEKQKSFLIKTAV